MKSEVELNQKNILANDILVYVDETNCQIWTVTELFDGGFEAKDDYETKYFIFSELQIGWKISDKTKEFNKQNFRTNYENKKNSLCQIYDDRNKCNDYRTVSNSCISCNFFKEPLIK